MITFASKAFIIFYFRKQPNEKKPHHTNGIQDPVDCNGYREKKALFDELSIPFIDASPAPSPKPGRSTDRYQFISAMDCYYKEFD